MLNEYITYLESESKSPATIKTYSLAIDEFLNCIGKDETEITKIDVVNYTAHLTKSNLAPASIRIKMNAVSSYFKFLADVEIVEKNVATNIKKPKIVSKEKHFMEEDDVKAIINKTLNLRDKAFLIYAATTGLRFSEIANTTLEDFEKAVENGNVYEIKCKGGKIGKVFLNATCINAVKEYIANERAEYIQYTDTKSKYLFNTCTGKQIANQAIDKMVKRCAEEAGIEYNVSCHCFRAYCASHLNEMGVDIGTIRDILHHSSTEITSRYIKTSNRQLQSANELLNMNF